MLCQRILHDGFRMGRSIVVMKLICSLGHCECEGHAVHKLSQRRLIADWLAPRETDCSRMYSKVSSDWLPSYIKATRPLLEIFKMAEYFPDSPRTSILFLGLLALSWKAPISLLQVRPPALPSERISAASTRWISVKFHIVDI